MGGSGPDIYSGFCLSQHRYKDLVFWVVLRLTNTSKTLYKCRVPTIYLYRTIEPIHPRQGLRLYQDKRKHQSMRDRERDREEDRGARENLVKTHPLLPPVDPRDFLIRAQVLRWPCSYVYHTPSSVRSAWHRVGNLHIG